MRLSESLRRKLEALGIPPSKHTVQGLSAYFPQEFHIADAGLDETRMAGVLLRFVERGILVLPPSPAGRSLPAGSHVGAVYRTVSDLLDFVAPFFERGIEDGAFCVWIVPDILSTFDALEALGSRIPAWNEAMARGQTELLRRVDCYTTADGIMRPVDDILAGYQALLDGARKRGYEQTRAAGDASWAGRMADAAAFLDYERRVDAFIRENGVTALCTCRLHECSDSLLRGIMRVHPQTFLRAGQSWRAFGGYNEARESLAASILGAN